MIRDVDRKKIHQYIDQKIDELFTGKIQFFEMNFFKGNVSNVNLGREPIRIWEEKSEKINQ